MKIIIKNYLFVVVLYIMLVCPLYSSYAQNDEIEIFDKNSKPYGKTYGEWSAEWWKWLLSIPLPDNPRLDQTGSKCGTNQNEKNVWFLVQTSEGNVKRQCEIPFGKSIFIPILTGQCDFISNLDLKTEPQLRECAQWGIQNAVVKASLNDISITENIERVQSPIFNFTLIPNHLFSSVDPITGHTEAVLDGYYIFIESLPPGNHTMKFSAFGIDNPIIGTTSFAYSVEYILEVN
jgi:hypothetical protein